MTARPQDALPRAAIIIPHFNDVERLRTCLRALVPQAERHPVEIVVADNASDVDLSPIAADFPQVRIITEAEKGAAAARNAGVAASRAPRLFFIDSDCIPAPGWLDRAMAHGGPDRMIGGRVEVFDETPPPRSGAEAFEAVFAFPQRINVEKKGFSVTANLLVTRAMFDRVGAFDGGKAEDYDWCLRAGQEGYEIEYDDALVVRHPTRPDWPALSRKWARLTNEGYFQNGTGPLDRLRWALRGGAVALSGIAHQPRMLGARALAPSERWRGGATLLRLRGLRALWMWRQALLGAVRER